MKRLLLLLLLIPAVSAYVTPAWNENRCSNATSVDEFYACGDEQRKIVEKLIEYYNVSNGTAVRAHLAPENEPYVPMGKISGDFNESAVAYAPFGAVYMGGAWPCNDGAQLEKYAENGYTRYECYQTRGWNYADVGSPEIKRLIEEKHYEDTEGGRG